MINLILYKLGIFYNNKTKDVFGGEEAFLTEQYVCDRTYIKARETPTSTKIRYGVKEYTFVKVEHSLKRLPRFLVATNNVLKKKDIKSTEKVLNSVIYIDNDFKYTPIDFTQYVFGYVAQFNREHLTLNHNFISNKISYLCNLNEAEEKDEDDVTLFVLQKKCVPFVIAAAQYNIFHLINKPKVRCDMYSLASRHKAGIALDSYFSETVIMRDFQRRYLLRTFRVPKGAFWRSISLLSKVTERLNYITLFFKKKKKLLSVLKKLLIWVNFLKFIIKKVYRMLKRSFYRRRLSIGKHFRKFVFSIPYQKVLNVQKVSKIFKLVNRLKKKYIYLSNRYNVLMLMFKSVFCYFRSIFFVIFFKFILRLKLVKYVPTFIDVNNLIMVKGTRAKVAAHLPDWFFKHFVLIKRFLFLIRNILKLRARKLNSFRVLKKKLKLRKKALLISKRKKLKYVVV